MQNRYETVIGLEVHVELATKTKIFCGCSTAFGGAKNAHTCPVCLGLPGALPALNQKAVEYALAVGIAAGCEITKQTRFDRKNYFYPDNPQNYQISQLYFPICRNGKIEIETESGETKWVRIHEIHMEDDAGKLRHDARGNVSLIDYNRSGAPLIEIVSMPDMRSGEQAVEYLKKLRLMIQYLGVSDCKLQEGSMRADVNLSVRKKGETSYGVRTEMKNLSSMKAVLRAVRHETNRQISLLEAGKTVAQETRRWDDAKGCSYSMRSKEEAKDYRYFPEPDLPSVEISDEWIFRIKQRQPEFRTEKMIRYQKEYHLPEYDAAVLTEHKKLADFFEAATAICGKPKKVSNWLMGETMRLLNERAMEPDQLSCSPKHLAELIDLTEAGVISNSLAKEVFEMVFANDVSPSSYVEENGLKTVDDTQELQKIIKRVLEQNPKSVQDYLGGKKKAIGFLVGQTMKATQGRAEPARTRELLEESLLKLL